MAIHATGKYFLHVVLARTDAVHRGIHLINRHRLSLTALVYSCAQWANGTRAVEILCYVPWGGEHGAPVPLHLDGLLTSSQRFPPYASSP